MSDLKHTSKLSPLIPVRHGQMLVAIALDLVPDVQTFWLNQVKHFAKGQGDILCQLNDDLADEVDRRELHLPVDIRHALQPDRRYDQTA